ncbi:MAG: tRNA (adenosine(37)-N6)-dimethylallyltransferase MiaA, partial [Candidatus Latescibacterota bacterium]
MNDRILCLVGPTASGKTEVGILLAERLGGEILSADARQVYRRLDIGTAKPTAAERARAAHHLLDLVDPDEAFHAGRFLREAERAIEAVRSRGRLPIVVGGTGLYVRALVR